jgi:sugar (pentulose or hexulose) kinase
LNLGASAAAIEKQLASRPSPRHGLTVLPFWTTARAPTWDEEAQGVIVGLKQSTSALDMLQAITEGFYFRLALIAEMIGGHPQWIVAGGILNSRSALQRLANVMGEPLRANSEPEASLRGAAVFALEKLQIELPQLKYGVPVKPTAAVHRLYLKERTRQAQIESISHQWRT